MEVDNKGHYILPRIRGLTKTNLNILLYSPRQFRTVLTEETILHKEMNILPAQ